MAARGTTRRILPHPALSGLARCGRLSLLGRCEGRASPNRIRHVPYICGPYMNGCGAGELRHVGAPYGKTSAMGYCWAADRHRDLANVPAFSVNMGSTLCHPSR